MQSLCGCSGAHLETHKLPSQTRSASWCLVVFPRSSFSVATSAFPPVRRRRHLNRHRRRPQRDHVRQPRLPGSPEAAPEASPEGLGGGLRLRVPQGSAKRCRPGPRGGRGPTGGYGYGRRDEHQRRGRRRGWKLPQRHPVMACAAYILVFNVRMKYFQNCTNQKPCSTIQHISCVIYYCYDYHL